MKKLYFLILSILLISCNNGIEKPRIGIAGIAIESSTFPQQKQLRETLL